MKIIKSQANNRFCFKPLLLCAKYVSISLLFILTSFAFAEWTTNGPYGLGSTAIEINPNNSDFVYVSGDAIIFRSTNQGESFTPYSAGIPDSECINALAVHPINSGIVFAGGKYNLYRSTDSGATWSQTGSGIPPQTSSGWGISDILIDPAAPNTIYVSTWAFDYTNMHFGGVYKSTDGGENFFDITPDIDPLQVDNFRVHALDMDAVDHNIIYAGIWGNASTNGTYGIWKTTNGGQTWSPTMMHHYELTILSVKTDPEITGRLFAAGQDFGCWLSNDYGSTWELVVPAYQYLEYPGPLGYSSIDAKETSVFYACEAAGLFRSTNLGIAGSWARIENGIRTEGYSEVNIAETSEQLIFVGGCCLKNLYRSTDNGDNFVPLSNGFPTLDAYCVGAAIDDTSTVYCGDPYPIGGLFKTENNGDVWFQTMFPTWPTIEVAVCPNNSNIVLGAWRDDFYAPPAYYVHQSTDGGVNFATSESWPGVGEIVFDPVNTNIVYATIPIETPTHFYVSTDAGASFAPIYDEGIPFIGMFISPLVVEEPSILYAGSSNGCIYKSTDAGNHWIAVNAGIEERDMITSLSKCYLDGSGIVAGTDSGVYRTTNGGANWFKLGDLSYKINDAYSANSVTYFGSDSVVLPILWAATDYGVFEYSESNWIAQNEGLDTLLVRELAITIPINDGSPTNKYSVLHAATPLGVYEYALGAPSATYETNSSEINARINLQSFPNPCQSLSTISFAIPYATKVNLSVYDVSGRLVVKLIDAHLQAGTHTASLDASELASGVYLYRLNAGELNATRKLVVMK